MIRVRGQKLFLELLPRGEGEGSVMTDRCFMGGDGICYVLMFFLKH